MFLAFIFITAPWTMISRIKPAKSPEVLQDRALEVLHALGYTDPPADSARGFNARDAFIGRTNFDKTITDRLARMSARPGPYEFWYRQSPARLEAVDRDGMIRAQSPIPFQPGEVLIRSDSAGRLELLAALPPRNRTATTAQVSDAIIKRLFEFADLDPARFTPADPILRSFAPVDSMRSWTGTLADQPDLPIRVHLGAVEGAVAYFGVAYPWTVASWTAKTQPPQPTSPLEYAAGAMLALVIAATCRLAWKNLKTARGDRAGALRLGVAVFLFAAFGLAVVQHRLPAPRTILGEGGVFAPAAFAGVEFWLFYIALEPYARRLYPQALVSWTRILRGNINDPLVGRHILIGLLLGACSILFTGIFASTLHSWMQPTPRLAFYGRTSAFLGGFPVVTAVTADCFVTPMMLGAGSMLTVVCGQFLSNRRWVGYAMLALALAALEIGTLRQDTIEGVAGIVIAMIPVLAIRPGGMLALIVTHMTICLGQMLPVGFDWTHWFSAPVFIPASILAALTLLAARAASAGRSAA
jgi:hypothetical protein